MNHNPMLKHLRDNAMLSQSELARLLDISQTRISRYESGEEYPPFNVVLAYYTIFGRPPHLLIPDLFERIEDEVMRRCAELETELRNKHDRASIKKRGLLERMASRARNRSGA